MFYTCGVCQHDHDNTPSLYELHMDHAVTPVPRIAAALLIISAFIIGGLIGWAGNEFVRARQKHVAFNALPDYVQPAGFAREWERLQ